MGASANATKLANLIDPQVLADYIDKKLIDGIRFAPLATIDNTLVGRPGDKLTFPYWSYVGDSVAVSEGADIPIAQLSQTPVTVTVSKIGRAIEYTDEALLSGYNNDVAEEAAKQVVMSINSAVEGLLLNAMSTNATLTKAVTLSADTDAADEIADALTLFGEDIDGEKVIAIPPSFYAYLRKSTSWIPNTEIGANTIIRGTVGMVHGCQIVTSNRLTTPNTAYIIKPGALRIVMKRDTLVEYDRDIISETNYIKASKLFAPYVYDASKLIKITFSAG